MCTEFMTRVINFLALLLTAYFGPQPSSFDDSVLSPAHFEQVSVTSYGSVTVHPPSPPTTVDSMFVSSVSSSISTVDSDLDIEDYEPHSGLAQSFRKGLSYISATSGDVSLVDASAARVEGIVLCILSLSRATSMSDALLTILLYVRTLSNRSISQHLLAMIGGDDPLVPQAGEPGSSNFDSELLDKSPFDWMSAFKQMSTSWAAFVHAPIFRRVSKLLSIACAIGVCDAANLEVSWRGIRFFSVEAYNKQVCALDLADAVFSTVSHFVLGTYGFFRTGNISCLVYGSDGAETFEQAFMDARHQYQILCTGVSLSRSEENDFSDRLEKLHVKAKELVAAAVHPKDKQQYVNYEKHISVMVAGFNAKRSRAGGRHAPFTYSLYGPTSVGKSTVSSLLMAASLNAMGHDASPDRICTLDQRDKYDSNYLSKTNGVHIDDFGNIKKEYLDIIPEEILLKLNNNVPAYALKAEIEGKGAIAMNFFVLGITKNIKLTADGSHFPASIARREDCIITISIRDEFATDGMLDPFKVKDFYHGDIPEIPDLWLFKVERAYPLPAVSEGRAPSVGYKILSHNGALLDGVDINTLIEYIIHASIEHQATQEKVVARMNTSHTSCAVCRVCRKLKTRCVCVDKPLGDIPPLLHLPIKEDVSLYDEVTVYTPHFEIGQIFFPLTLWARNRATGLHFQAYIDFMEWWGVYYICLLPQCLRSTWLARLCWYYLHRDAIYDEIYTAYLQILILLVVLTWISFLAGHCYCFVVFPFFIYLFWNSFVCTIDAVGRIYLEEPSMLVAASELWRYDSIRRMLGAGTALGTLLLGLRFWRTLSRTAMDPHGNISPTSYADIAARDKEQNDWAKFECEPIPGTPVSKSTHPDHLIKVVGRQLLHMHYEQDGKTFSTNALFLKTHFIMIPNHVWNSDEMSVNFARNTNGGSFSALISRANSYRIPGTDFSVVSIAGGGSVKDITEYFPLSSVSTSPALLIYKKRDCGIITSVVTLGSPATVRTSNLKDGGNVAESFLGYHYKTEFPTFPGQCMAPIITTNKSPVIAACHLGGITGTTTGGGGAITKGQIDDAISHLRSVRTVFPATSASRLDLEQYDVQFFSGPTIHPKSPVNYLPEGSRLAMFGECIGRAKYYSKVVPTLISDAVESVCGVPNKWGKPAFEAYPFQASLAQSTNPSGMFPNVLLDSAMADYTDVFLSVLDGFPELKAEVAPLTDLQSVCGVVGRRFIDGMVGKTSIGFPLTGPKSDVWIPLEEGTEGIPDPKTFPQFIWDRVAGSIAAYTSGLRSNDIFKVFLKDEPTKIGKKKVRCVQAAPISLQLNMRKYFLPIVRLLSTLPIMSECAVGINAVGLEWGDRKSVV